MKALVQRVASAKVEVAGRVTGEIQKGLLVFLCAMEGDTQKDLEYLAKKVIMLRIFSDEQGKMNLSVSDVEGEVLVISQFTLSASTRKGNRPSFEGALEPTQAKILYEKFIRGLRNYGVKVETGEFAATMAVFSVNDGPVTIMIDSRDGQ